MYMGAQATGTYTEWPDTQVRTPGGAPLNFSVQASCVAWFGCGLKFFRGALFVALMEFRFFFRAVNGEILRGQIALAPLLGSGPLGPRRQCSATPLPQPLL